MSFARSWVGLAIAFTVASPMARAEGEPSSETPGSARIRVSGRVIDSAGRPVRGASVASETGQDRSTTDANGRFALQTAVGTTLVITSDRNGVALANATGPVIDDIVLELDLSNENIEIGGEAPTAALGAATLDRHDLQRLPGTGGDVVRALSAMPGVVNQQLPLGYSGVVIRGASPQDSKVLVDDFEIPILFHPLGIRAIVPAESIQSLEFVPGGFDVAYGRSSSGIVRLTTRAGSDRRTTQGEVSLIDGGVLAQGPIGDRTRYMVGVRRSVIDFVVPLVLPDSVDLSLTTVPNYYDEQFRIDHELSSRWTLMVSSVGTNDIFELFTTKNESAGAKRFFSQTRFLRLTTAAKYHRGEWQANLGLSSMVTDLNAEIGLYQKLRVRTPLVTPRAVLTRSAASAFGLKDVVWSGGAEAQIGHSTVDMALPVERREGEAFGPYDPTDTTSRFRGSVWFPDYAIWSSVAATLDPRIRITNGVRVDYFGRPNEIAVQPRTEIKVKLHDALTARLSAGAFRRPPEFQSEFLDENVKSERSNQYTMGLEFVPLLGIRLQGSLYYTDRTRLITRNADATLGNRGRGLSKGAELLAMIHSGGSWFGWLGYSYSHSERVDQVGRAARLFDYDQPHNLNAAVSYKRGRWQLGARFQVYSGLPHTPITGAEFDSDRNLHIPISGAINSDRVPIHHQFDIRVDCSWKWGGTAWLAFLDVQNVYLNRTVVTYFYGYDYTQRSAFESLPLIPSAGLRAVL